MKSKRYYIFISFHHSQEELANKFYDTLKKRGFEVFNFKKVQRSSNDYEKKIEEGLKNSNALLLLCNSNSKESKKVQKECIDFYKFGDKREVFIFEDRGFKEEDVPPITGWNKKHRVSDFNKQIEDIEAWKNEKKRKRIITTNIILSPLYLTLLSAIVFGIYILIDKNPSIKINVENTRTINGVAVKDTTIYETANINLSDLLKVEPNELRSEGIWTFKGNIISGIDISDSGMYVVQLTYRERIIKDSLFLNVKSPCEGKSVEFEKKVITHKEGEKINKPKVQIEGFNNNDSPIIKWRKMGEMEFYDTENGPFPIESADLYNDAGKYIISVKDNICEKYDTIEIRVIKLLNESLPYEPEVRMELIRQYTDEIKNNNITSDDIFSLYVTKLDNMEEFKMFEELLREKRRGVIYAEFDKNKPEVYQNYNVIIYESNLKIIKTYPKNKIKNNYKEIENYNRNGKKVKLIQFV